MKEFEVTRVSLFSFVGDCVSVFRIYKHIKFIVLFPNVFDFGFLFGLEREHVLANLRRISGSFWNTGVDTTFELSGQTGVINNFCSPSSLSVTLGLKLGVTVCDVLWRRGDRTRCCFSSTAKSLFMRFLAKMGSGAGVAK